MEKDRGREEIRQAEAEHKKLLRMFTRHQKQVKNVKYGSYKACTFDAAVYANEVFLSNN